MKKLFLLAAACLMMAAIFVSCSSAPATPSDKAVECIELLKNYDYEGLADEYYFGDSMSEEEAQQTRELIVSLGKEKAQAQQESHGGIASYEITSEEIAEDGNSAVVKAVITYGDGNTDNQKLDLVKIDNEWKLAWNK